MATQSTCTKLHDACEFLREAHLIATGNMITGQEAMAYFRNPKLLAQAIEASGVLDDPEKRLALERLLSRASPEVRSGL